MLDRLENIFLTILQVVIIAGAAMLLITGVITALLSLQAIVLKSAKEGRVPQVAAREIVEALTQQTQPRAHETEATTRSNEEDPNSIFYERVSNAIVAFANKHSKDGGRWIDRTLWQYSGTSPSHSINRRQHRRGRWAWQMLWKNVDRYGGRQACRHLIIA
ncbi:MAG: hypothetical protein C4326_13405 [Ignavibacteria bacterium]